MTKEELDKFKATALELGWVPICYGCKFFDHYSCEIIGDWVCSHWTCIAFDPDGHYQWEPKE